MKWNQEVVTNDVFWSSRILAALWEMPPNCQIAGQQSLSWLPYFPNSSEHQNSLFRPTQDGDWTRRSSFTAGKCSRISIPRTKSVKGYKSFTYSKPYSRSPPTRKRASRVWSLTRSGSGWYKMCLNTSQVSLWRSYLFCSSFEITLLLGSRCRWWRS